MKFTCERSILSNALGIVNKAVSSRSTLPILSQFLVETDGDKIKITGTDLDTAIIYKIPAQINTPGSLAVSANLLIDIITKLPDAPITIDSTDEGKAIVSCGKSKYTMLTQPALDYPAITMVGDKSTTIKITQKTLKDMLHMTTGAASKEETRSILMGVLFELDDKELVLVATDTHRLAMKKSTPLTILRGEGTENQWIVPARPLAELERVIKDSDDEITLNLSSSKAQFSTDDFILVARILDGQFPNYKKVIPKEINKKVTFDKESMLSALKRVYIVAKSSSEKATIEIKADIAYITAESADVGKAHEEVPVCEAPDEEDMTVAYNTRYFMEALNTMQNGVVSMNLTGALNPGTLKYAEKDDFIHVIMPMQV